MSLFPVKLSKLNFQNERVIQYVVMFKCRLITHQLSGSYLHTNNSFQPEFVRSSASHDDVIFNTIGLHLQVGLHLHILTLFYLRRNYHHTLVISDLWKNSFPRVLNFRFSILNFPAVWIYRRSYGNGTYIFNLLVF